MSATNRGGKRIADDFYETPASAIDPIAALLPWRGYVLDAGCGRGNILARLIERWDADETVAMGVESDAGRVMAARARSISVAEDDFLTAESLGEPDVVVSNPPYRLAQRFVEKALGLVAPQRGTVVMLLRLCWLGSIERAAFHRKHPADVYVLPRRPAFAASVKCGPTKRQGCGWSVMQPLEDPRTERCPECGKETTVTTTDATEFAWFVWGPARGGRWSVLETPGSTP